MASGKAEGAEARRVTSRFWAVHLKRTPRSAHVFALYDSTYQDHLMFPFQSAVSTPLSGIQAEPMHSESGVPFKIR